MNPVDEQAAQNASDQIVARLEATATDAVTPLVRRRLDMLDREEAKASLYRLADRLARAMHHAVTTATNRQIRDDR